MGVLWEVATTTYIRDELVQLSGVTTIISHANFISCRGLKDTGATNENGFSGEFSKFQIKVEKTAKLEKRLD